MTSACGRARRQLWPDNGPRTVTADVIAAQQHVATCEPCVAFFREMRETAEHIHNAAPQPVAPLEVRDRLFERVATARTGSTNRSRLPSLWIAGWAAALLLLVIGLKVVREGAPEPQQPLIALLAGEHARALGGLSIRSSDPSEIARWLKGRLPFAMLVPVFVDAHLRGARVLELDRTHGVLIEYGIGDEPISYLVLSSPDAARLRGDPVLRAAVWDGYRIESWNEPGLIHAMIGHVPASTLRHLATDCIEQARSTMSVIPATLEDSFTAASHRLNFEADGA